MIPYHHLFSYTHTYFILQQIRQFCLSQIYLTFWRIRFTQLFHFDFYIIQYLVSIRSFYFSFVLFFAKICSHLNNHISWIGKNKCIMMYYVSNYFFYMIVFTNKHFVSIPLRNSFHLFILLFSILLLHISSGAIVAESKYSFSSTVLALKWTLTRAYYVTLSVWWMT